MPFVARRIACYLGLALALAGYPARLEAHEGGVLRVSPRAAAPGDTLSVVGEQFARGGRVRLVLAGTEGRWSLLEATTDTAGRFAQPVRLPVGLADGAYRLVAIAPDGDEITGVDLVVAARAAGSPGAEPSPGGHGHLDLPRARHPIVTGLALAVVLGSVVAAIPLLKGAQTPD